MRQELLVPESALLLVLEAIYDIIASENGNLTLEDDMVV